MNVPNVLLVRVLTPGGPYVAGDMLSVAFAVPTVGRLVAHRQVGEITRTTDGDALVPETITVRVTHGDGTYADNCLLALAFVDPCIARIHAIGDGVHEAAPDRADGSSERRKFAERAEVGLLSASIDRAPVSLPRVDDTRVEPSPLRGEVSMQMEGAIACGPSADDTSASTLSVSKEMQSPDNVRYDVATSADATPPSQAGDAEPAESSIAVFTEASAQAEPGAHSTESLERPTPTRGTIDTSTQLPSVIISARDSQTFLRISRSTNHAESSTSEVGHTATETRRSTTDAEPSKPLVLVQNELTALDSAGVVDSHIVAEHGIRVRLQWTPDRVRRFVQLVDKLFTVERLGWYRHALAMRLLIPDEISCGDPVSDMEAMRHLHALRGAAVATLGRPLLAAFMPNFVVSSEWLVAIDSPAAARALAGLRDAIFPTAERAIGGGRTALEEGWTVGALGGNDFLHAHATNVEAFIPILIASESTRPKLTERLIDYRRALLDAFGQTAHSAEAVRLTQMAKPNHSLDDRLWQLVGTVGESFDGLAVA